MSLSSLSAEEISFNSIKSPSTVSNHPHPSPTSSPRRKTGHCVVSSGKTFLIVRILYKERNTSVALFNQQNTSEVSSPCKVNVVNQVQPCLGDTYVLLLCLLVPAQETKWDGTNILALNLSSVIILSHTFTVMWKYVTAICRTTLKIPKCKQKADVEWVKTNCIRDSVWSRWRKFQLSQEHLVMAASYWESTGHRSWRWSRDLECWRSHILLVPNWWCLLHSACWHHC